MLNTLKNYDNKSVTLVNNIINYIVIAVRECRHSHATNNICNQNKSDHISCEGKVNNAIF